MLDCNGAALKLFRARTRADLCGPQHSLLDLVHGNKDRLKLRKVGSHKQQAASSTSLQPTCQLWAE